MPGIDLLLEWHVGFSDEPLHIQHETISDNESLLNYSQALDRKFVIED